VIKLIVKDKVEVISNWNDEKIRWCSSSIDYPSVVRLKYYRRIGRRKVRFNRLGIFRRDMNTCQYCGIVLHKSKLTIDHILPTSQGGRSSWENCVTCCIECNADKANRIPEEAGMKLLTVPATPVGGLTTEFILTSPKHDDWIMYFPQVEKIEPKIHT